MAATHVSRVWSIQEICVRFNLILFASLGFIPGLPMISAQAQGVADPKAEVPALIYRSVFQEAGKGLVSDAKDWREANDEVGQFKRGHIDVLKWEGQNSASGGNATAPTHGHPSPAVKKP